MIKLGYIYTRSIIEWLNLERWLILLFGTHHLASCYDSSDIFVTAVDDTYSKYVSTNGNKDNIALMKAKKTPQNLIYLQCEKLAEFWGII